MEELKEWFNDLWSHETAFLFLLRMAGFVLVIALAYLSNIIVKKHIMRLVKIFIDKSKTKWDDTLIKQKVFLRLCHIVPALVIYILTPVVFRGYHTVQRIVQYGAGVYMILIGILALDAFLTAVMQIYKTYDISRKIPIHGFIQMIKIILYVVGVILILSVILKKDPTNLIAGLGAMTAVIMLVFKDSILGLMAGFQLTVNQMVRIGDWIEIPKYGVDGDVIDITLTTVKVQNWDKTLSTIPAYTLFSDTFKNWRGMTESGGRRIKRSIYIDMTTVKICTPQMIEKYKKFQLLKKYIERKVKELEEYNKAHNVDDAEVINGRRLTNIGTFRAYVIAYLKNHPLINQDMTLLVRQLQPTPQGLPIEIYVFSKDTVWANYEALQADIFDHILAVVSEFDLRVFQTPSGADISRLKGSIS